MIQVATYVVQNQGRANEELRKFQRDFPKREILTVAMNPIEWPGGWFMTITYKIKE